MSSVDEFLTDIEFPEYTTRSECVAAVQEVRDYIHEHEKASKDQMWERLVLDRSTPSPGREVCRSKGYVPKFEDWWWETIIVPGLHELPDVAPIHDTDEKWWRASTP